MSLENSTKSQEIEEQWISISDMMAGLMVIFLFIAISYMLFVRAEKGKIEEIAVKYEAVQNALYQDLETEFRDDLDVWQAVLDREKLSVRFEEPEVLFGQGQSNVRPVFKEILSDFFPRFVRILRKPDYKDSVVEIRIEGHTSSEWFAGAGPDEAYIRNMELSQGRTRSVLAYVLQLSPIAGDPIKGWLKDRLTANGLSSSQPITRNGAEDLEASRRVEFRVRTNAEERIVEILKQGSS